MDRDFLTDLFSDFGPVTIRRMFSGFGISADGTNFALALRGGVYLRADEHSIPRFEPRFEVEGAKPFQYQTRTRTVTVASYWQLPERLYDDPHELSEWARVAFAAAQRAALSKRPRRRTKAGRKAADGTAKKAANKKPVGRKSAVRKKPARTKAPRNASSS
jgi:DNA transformation protein